MKIIVFFSILTLCIFDGLATAYSVSNGVEELNPFVAFYIDFLGFEAFVYMKVFLAIGIAAVIFKFWDYKFVKFGGFIVAVVYLLTALYHIVFMKLGGLI